MSIFRKKQSRRRLRILDEDFAPLVRARIAEVYAKPHVREQISAHVSEEHNLLLRLADEIAAPLYETPPVRRFAEGQADEAQHDALAELVRLVELETFMPLAVTTAFAVNVAFVVPVWRGAGASGRPDLELVTPDVADVVLDDEDPRRLKSLTYQLAASDDDPERAVRVDAHGWHYLDEDGEVLRTVAVELGRCPAVPLRLQRTRDFWGGRRGAKVVSATIEIARILAQMSWIRTTNSARIVAFFADGLDDKVPAHQHVDQRTPLVINAPPDEASVQVLDLEVSIKNFKEEIRTHAEPVLESYGLPWEAYTFDGSGMVDHQLLASSKKKVRARQLPNAIAFERELFDVLVRLVRAYGHPIGAQLDPELIERHYEVHFGELTFGDDPLKQIEIQERKMSHGFMNPTEAYAYWNPGTPPEEAHRRMEANLQDRGRLIQIQAEHNLPGDASHDGDYLAQLQGRLGQLERGPATRTPRNKDDDHADDAKP